MLVAAKRLSEPSDPETLCGWTIPDVEILPLRVNGSGLKGTDRGSPVDD